MPTKRLHLALSTRDIPSSVADYTRRLGVPPTLVVPGEYALWRTDCVNLSVRNDRESAPGTLRHLGWEDPETPRFGQDTDVNGITWERFTDAQQLDEIEAAWPGQALAGAQPEPSR